MLMCLRKRQKKILFIANNNIFKNQNFKGETNLLFVTGPNLHSNVLTHSRLLIIYLLSTVDSLKYFVWLVDRRMGIFGVLSNTKVCFLRYFCFRRIFLIQLFALCYVHKSTKINYVDGGLIHIISCWNIQPLI